jgi:type IV pilus assembly protein PilB
LVASGYSPKTAEKVRVYKGEGCEVCGGSGYKGRVAIYEVMEMTPALRDLVLRHPSADDLKRLAIKEGMKTLRMSALTKVHEGATTLEEAVGNSSSDKL